MRRVPRWVSFVSVTISFWIVWASNGSDPEVGTWGIFASAGAAFALMSDAYQNRARR